MNNQNTSPVQNKSIIDNLTQKAFMASSNYIKKNYLILPSGFSEASNLKLKPAIPVSSQNELISQYQISEGLTGIPVCNEQEIAITEAEKFRRNSDMAYSWLEINIPKDDFLLDLSKKINEQPEFVQSAIFDSTSLNFLFPDDIQQKLEETYQALNKEKNTNENIAAAVNQEINQYYEMKRNFINNLGTGLNYINFINSQNISKDYEQTSAYLYKIKIKGVKYFDSNGSHILIFDAHKDITVSNIFESRFM